MVDTSKMYFYSSYGKSVTIHGGTIVEAWINAEYCSLPTNTETIKTEISIANVKVGSKDIQIVPNYNKEKTNTETNQNQENQENTATENTEKSESNEE